MGYRCWLLNRGKKPRDEDVKLLNWASRSLSNKMCDYALESTMFKLDHCRENKQKRNLGTSKSWQKCD